jgi:crotonobetainyl-CoA:carnitine CoA-transferase CaiB-like acyl-CoA transferase
MLLAALGADVVKIEHPERGDDTRQWAPPYWGKESPVYLLANAGKRSLAVDVKTDEGLEIVRRLAEGCDVFVQNMRPGLADRIGLGYDALKESNQRLVYCSIGAFGAVGPLADRPGYDPLMQAFSGIMSLTGEPDRPPVRLGISAVDQGAGMWAVIGILAALRARDDGTGPQLVETSLYETAVNWVAYQLAGYLGSGSVPKPLGTTIGFIAPYQAFDSSDGRIMLAAPNDRLFASLCDALGASELAADDRFRTNPDRCLHRDELARAIQERFASLTCAEWLDRLYQAGVPAAPVQNLAEVAAHPQTEALELLQPLDHPALADLRLVRPPLAVGEERVRHTAAAPALGEHTDEILASLGYSRAAIAGLRDRRVVAG